MTMSYAAFKVCSCLKHNRVSIPSEEVFGIIQQVQEERYSRQFAASFRRQSDTVQCQWLVLVFNTIVPGDVLPLESAPGDQAEDQLSWVLVLGSQALGRQDQLKPEKRLSAGSLHSQLILASLLMLFLHQACLQYWKKI